MRPNPILGERNVPAGWYWVLIVAAIATLVGLLLMAGDAMARMLEQWTVEG